MGRYLGARLVQSVFLCWAVSLIVFVGVYAIGDPMSLLVPPEAGQEATDRLRDELGLNLPLWRQYLRFAANAAHGNLGESFVFRESAVRVILERLPATFELALSAMVIATIVGIPLGLLAGAYPDTALDRALTVGSVLGFSLPTFWVGILLIFVFAVQLGWLPASGRGETVSVLGIGFSLFTVDGLRHLALPALNLALFPLGFIIRLTRSGMREAMGLDFTRFARAQGNSRRQVVQHYVLKYVSIPIVTLVGLYFGILLAFAVVTESVFSWPGMGKLIIDSINRLDRPVIVAYMMMTVIIIIVLSLVVDLFYALLDPRVRLE